MIPKIIFSYEYMDDGFHGTIEINEKQVWLSPRGYEFQSAAMEDAEKLFIERMKNLFCDIKIDA